MRKSWENGEILNIGIATCDFCHEEIHNWDEHYRSNFTSEIVHKHCIREFILERLKSYVIPDQDNDLYKIDGMELLKNNAIDYLSTDFNLVEAYEF